MRALISTIPPGRGGVPVMLRTALELLAERDLETEVAWYEPHGMNPRLSVPTYRLGTRRPGAERRELPGAVSGNAFGAWLPELELTHYWPTRLWRERIEAADLHLVVSGTALAGLAFQRAGRPFLAWLASDWSGDRRDRVRSFPLPRRWLDALLVRPLTRKLERRVLHDGAIVALSEATRQQLDLLAGRPVVRAVAPCPVDVDSIRPNSAARVPGRVGFAGRFDDPRKNLRLFLEVVALARTRFSDLRGEVLGGTAGEPERRLVDRLGLAGAVRFSSPSREEYVERLATLDLLVLTSHQEGLGIAALEAMAAGAPVVSTRCGGPEEYLRDGENGFLCGFRADEIAERVLRIVENPRLRERFGARARDTVVRGYSPKVARSRLGAEIDRFLRDRSAGALHAAGA